MALSNVSFSSEIICGEELGITLRVGTIICGLEGTVITIDGEVDVCKAFV